MNPGSFVALAEVGNLASSVVAILDLVGPLLTRWERWDEDPSIGGFEIFGLPPITWRDGRRLPATLWVRNDAIRHKARSQIEWFAGHDSILRLIGSLTVGAFSTGIFSDTLLVFDAILAVADEEQQLAILGPFQTSFAW